MADYDIGSAGGISVGQATYGSDNMYDFPRDIGATQIVTINHGLGVEDPLEPVRNIGAIQTIGLINPYTAEVFAGRLLRVNPRKVRS